MSKAGRRALLFLSVIWVFGPAVPKNPFAAERSSKPTLVRIATVSRSTLDLPFFVARDRGFFREEGLEVEIILMRSNLTLQAMVARSIDFGTATGAAVNAIVNGADVRVVLAMSDKPLFDLIAHPSITRVQQLRGKKIGVVGSGVFQK
jgi:NitT/TauT family transport system substrate-binding protein